MATATKKTLDLEKPVHIYWNLHKRVWSIRQDGIVMGHKSRLYLQDCTFHVQPAGNAKCRKEGRKNVHAYIKGWITSDAYKEPDVQVRYNPYIMTTFQCEGEPIRHTDYVYFREDGRAFKAVLRPPRIPQQDFIQIQA